MGLIKMRILEDDNLIGQLDKLDDILNKRVEKYKKYLKIPITKKIPGI